MPKVIIKLNDNLSQLANVITERTNNIIHNSKYKYIDLHFYEVEIIKNYYSNYNKRKSYSIEIQNNSSFAEYVTLHSQLETLLTRLNMEQNDEIRRKTFSFIN